MSDIARKLMGVTKVVSAAGWDISTASYLQSFSVAAQETLPRGLFFKPDGTKMYVVGLLGLDYVSEYDLSTAWDVSTASYLQNFSINPQDRRPLSVVFKPDGLKMYVFGGRSNNVNEYDLSTAWDVSTASYLQSFNVVAQTFLGQDVSFKSDGTKMYLMAAGSQDAVFEYDLSTAWDVSTASYLQNFNVAAQDSSSAGLFFKPDGTKMYMLGLDSDSVHEYDLSTAWDVSTASYLHSFSVAAQDSVPYSVFFKPDGTKMYVIGSTGDAVYEYDL